MTREMRFRVWDAMSKKMLSPHELGGFLLKDLSKVEGFEYSQYTGLKDKAGRDIYEGDILESRNESDCRGEVIFADGAYFYNCDSCATEKYLRLELIHNNALEVIGNIYENPDLLKV